MKKSIWIIFTFCALLAANVGAATGKVQGPAELITALSDSLEDCRHTYVMEVLSYKKALLAFYSKKRGEAKSSDGSPRMLKPWEESGINSEFAQIWSTMTAREYNFAATSKKAKTFAAGIAKPLVNSFKSASQKTAAKELLAQWFTTLGVIGESNFDEELTKYQKLENNFKIDLMIN